MRTKTRVRQPYAPVRPSFKISLRINNFLDVKRTAGSRSPVALALRAWVKAGNAHVAISNSVSMRKCVRHGRRGQGTHRSGRNAFEGTQAGMPYGPDAVAFIAKMEFRHQPDLDAGGSANRQRVTAIARRTEQVGLPSRPSIEMTLPPLATTAYRQTRVRATCGVRHNGSVSSIVVATPSMGTVARRAARPSQTPNRLRRERLSDGYSQDRRNSRSDPKKSAQSGSQAGLR